MPRRAEDGARALERGRDILRQEAAAVTAAAERLDERFGRAVRLVAGCRGRVILSGVGKSGIVAHKIAATMTSTGTAATYVHPVEALHGDLGAVGRSDVAIVLSKSGETEELFGLVTQLKRLGVPIIAMVGEPSSTLARHADVALDAAVETEACPFDLAPTTSTTVALALGDALTVAAYEARGFRAEDFAALHPGGSLGRRLLLTVQDVMVTDDLPALEADASMRACVVLLAERRGTVAVVDGARVVVGVVTAGDLTRLMERRDDFLDVPVGEVMTRSPKLARPHELAGAVVLRMEQMGIMAMPVVAEDGSLAGIVHLHDLLRAGAA